MMRCWEKNPDSRPTFEELRESVAQRMRLKSEHYGYISLPGMDAEDETICEELT